MQTAPTVLSTVAAPPMSLSGPTMPIIRTMQTGVTTQGVVQQREFVSQVQHRDSRIGFGGIDKNNNGYAGNVGVGIGEVMNNSQEGNYPYWDEPDQRSYGDKYGFHDRRGCGHSSVPNNFGTCSRTDNYHPNQGIRATRYGHQPQYGTQGYGYQGFFHKRHAKKSEGTATAKCKYTCHKCQDKKLLKSPIKSKAKTRKILSRKIAKSTRILRPRRGGKKVKYMSLRSSKVGGAKKMIKVKPKRGLPMKSKNKIQWHKGKRTQVYHAYWLNGLWLSRKPHDARATHFRDRNLLLMPVQQPSANLMRPTCCLCHEAEYKSKLIYVSCESCQEWFHGDAFGITSKNSNIILGFRCNKCLKRESPLCLHLGDPAVNDVLKEKDGPFDLKPCANEDSLGLQHNIEQKKVTASNTLKEDRGAYSVSDSICVLNPSHEIETDNPFGDL
ncbi:hypothetical protein GIB67_029138 [Kingdonia uniflora]|uniref:Uncharacterized protein n=1 Tax=Kingdonia uniflora TaxID=39325 RepID=A0A7J7N3P7_9MAGN|nr:hypothetical protein GIB67_029138 [Kingdonia uniflora]